MFNRLRPAACVALAVLVLPTAPAVTAQAAPAPAATPVAAATPLQAPVPVAAPTAHTSAAERKRVDRVKAPKIGWYKARAWDFYVATVRLPLDYDHPKGAKVEVALAKIPAAQPSRRIGTLFLNPGGPGGSGVELAMNASSFLSQDVLDRFDIVGFDPRGTNYGSKLKCFTSYRASTLTLQDLTEIPATAANLKTYRRAAKKLATGCSHHGRKLASAMSTTEVARDMDVLRRAVGDSKLSYLGFSYGTYLGETYANMFPDRFRAIALDGVINPVAWRGNSSSKNPMGIRLGSAEGAWKALSKAFELCRKAGTDYCLLADPMADLKSVAAKLRKAPLETDTGTLTYAGLVSALLGALYGQDGSAETAVTVVALVKEAIDGGADESAKAFKLLNRLARTPAFNFPYDNSTDAYSAVMCSESAQPRSQTSWIRAIDAKKAAAPYFSEVWGWTDLACARQYWTAIDEDRYRGSFSKQTAKPVLFVGDYYDPATSYASAVAAHKRMPNSWLLSSDSWGHTAYGSSDCVTDQVDAYLLRGRKPSGKVCADDYVPFSDKLESDEPEADPKLEISPAARLGLRPIGLPA